MAELIATTAESIVRTPRARVYVSPTLREPVWTEVEHLFLDTLSRVCGPGMDEAHFTYYYGDWMPPGETGFSVFSPLPLVGQYCKVVFELLATVSPDDPEAPPEVIAANFLTWHGVIEFDEKEIRGSAGSTPRGMQRFTAYGLLRLLERVVFANTHKMTDPDEDTTITIERGLSFNLHDSDREAYTGNRSVNASNGVYVFSDTPELQEEWTAYEAVRYLLKHHVPLDREGDPVATWELDSEEENLSWYKIAVHTDGKSAKDVLDELIPVKRGVFYSVSYDEANNTVKVKTHTVCSEDIVLAGQTLKANPDQKQLDFENAVDIVTCLVRNVKTTSYDRIVARGEFRTSTGTFCLDPDYEQIEQCWTEEERIQFLSGASDLTDYALLNSLFKAHYNHQYRTDAQRAHVFRRWRIADLWDQTLVDPEAEEPRTQYYFDPPVDADDNLITIFEEGNEDDVEQHWNLGLRIEKELVLKTQYDYSGENIADQTWDNVDIEGPVQPLRPLVYIAAGAHPIDEELQFWQNVEDLGQTVGFEEQGRAWSIEPDFSKGGAVFELPVVNGVQQFLDTDEWTSAEKTDPTHDPAKNQGLEWTDIRATLTVTLDSRVKYEVDLNPEILPGADEKVLVIEVPDARLDYVVPYTTVRLEGGGQIITTSGGYVADHRYRLEQVAKSAAAWYGKERQTLDLAFKQIRGAPDNTPLFQLGWLITDIGPTYSLVGVNTVITKITYTFQENNVTTRIETSFPEFDLQ